MSLLSRLKGKPKVAPAFGLTPLLEEAEATPIYALPEGFRYANNRPPNRTIYSQGFKANANKPMSNTNKAELAARRRAMIRAARNYGSGAGAAAAGGAGAAAVPRPELVIPNNNAAVPRPELVIPNNNAAEYGAAAGAAAAAAGAAAGAGATHNYRELGLTGAAAAPYFENMGAGAAAAAPAAGNGFTNVNLGSDGARSRRWRRRNHRRRTHRRRV